MTPCLAALERAQRIEFGRGGRGDDLRVRRDGQVPAGALLRGRGGHTRVQAGQGELERLRIGLQNAQIDKFGNINTTVIGGDYGHPKVRLPGAGGAPEIAASCREVIVVVRQSHRSFVERVDFVTSVGYGSGRGDRERLGLTGAGPKKIITDLGVLEPDPETLEFTLTGLYPGVAAAAAKEHTGWDLAVAAEPEIIAAPSPAASTSASSAPPRSTSSATSTPR